MNCKQGEMAFVVRQMIADGMLGRVVTVVRPAVVGEKFKSTCGGLLMNFVEGGEGGFAWVVEGASPLPWVPISGLMQGKTLFFKQRVVGDDFLRPILGQPGEDETISWAGKPESTEQPCKTTEFES